MIMVSLHNNKAVTKTRVLMNREEMKMTEQVSICYDGISFGYVHKNTITMSGGEGARKGGQGCRAHKGKSLRSPKSTVTWRRGFPRRTRKGSRRSWSRSWAQSRVLPDPTKHCLMLKRLEQARRHTGAVPALGPA